MPSLIKTILLQYVIPWFFSFPILTCNHSPKFYNTNYSILCCFNIWKVNLKDFHIGTLEAFIHFLTTNKVIFSKETILELYILGDKCHLKSLKEQSRQVLLTCINELDAEKIYDVISKIDKDLIKECFFRQFTSNSDCVCM